MDAHEVAEVMLDLQSQGCHNLNLVTPEHMIPQIVDAIVLAIQRGLHIPIVYNTSSYDSLASLKLLEGLVDIYLPDFKIWTERSARRLLRVHNYPVHARTAISEMHRQVGPLRLDDRGIAEAGLLVRHLVMPGMVDEGTAIVEWLARELSTETYVNLMAQYRPLHRVGTVGPTGAERYPEIARRPTSQELGAVQAAALRAGLHRFAD